MKPVPVHRVALETYRDDACEALAQCWDGIRTQLFLVLWGRASQVLRFKRQQISKERLTAAQRREEKD